MNTSKQVNVMIGLLFLAFLAFGAYILNEPNRSAKAEEAQDDLLLKRGAELFVNNCRTCHGLEGLGPDQGAIAPKLNNEAFWVFPADNSEGAPETPAGDVRKIETFIHDTIACGRSNSIMPVWGEEHGGSLSNTQINYLVRLITTPHGFDLVEEIGHEHDIETNTDPEKVQLTAADLAGAATTSGNCGQYTGALVQSFRGRDPFSTGGGDEGDGGGEATPGSDLPEAQAMIQGVLVGDFFANNCAACHGDQRQGLIGPPLTVDATAANPASFYIDCITNGRPGTAMQSWSDRLTADEIESMVAFLQNVPAQ
ncbi:MAG: c-type cytochrome [Dehalococcoidia bacterium]|nr:c-type cytochrome [Dehalococcoidia bacterium]MCA9849461.1 c-type cytochrome [Dehalococcoidia bacterium]MCB9483146.1 c-type cytochrome [Dehalococcoidia bacterium]